MPTLAYDTTWATRMGEFDPELSNRALDWICENQLDDGSWGAREPFYYHDRVISTLAKMIALAQHGRRASDIRMLKRGTEALNRIVGGTTQGLAADPNGATIGFEMIAPTLVHEAYRLGLIPSQDNRILGRLGNLRKIKQTKLKSRISRYITPAISAEMAGTDIDMLDIPRLPEQNGSIGYSPAATAYYAMFVQPGNSDALGYLRRSANTDGGMPDVAPFDVFEVAWVLWNLALTNPEIVNDPHVIKHVDFLTKAWDPDCGAGFAAGYSVCDGDESGLVFDTLRQYGVNLDVNIILSFEAENHFLCYALEANPSTSTHAHVLGALRKAGLTSDSPSVQKALGFLRRNRTWKGFWFDKWHLSPYYVTSHIVITCSEYAQDIVERAIEWLIFTQQPQGSWGINSATAEETAYCIQALWVWEKTRKTGNTLQVCQAIRKGLDWLKENSDPPYLPLWIGKGLYCPENVIRSAILGALALEGV